MNGKVLLCKRKKDSMNRVDYSKRESRLAIRIVAWFKKHRNEDLSFGAILDKYCEVGMAMKYVANLLMDMKSLDGSLMRKVIDIKATALREAWLSEKYHGRCEFVSYARFTGNPYHGNKGLIKKRTQNKSKEVVVEYVCTNCLNQKTSTVKLVGKRNLIALKVHRCLKCGKFGSCTGTFKLKGKKVTKAIIDNREQFLIEEGMESHESHSNNS